MSPEVIRRTKREITTEVTGRDIVGQLNVVRQSVKFQNEDDRRGDPTGRRNVNYLG